MLGSFCVLNLASVEEGSKFPSATPTMSSPPLSIEMPPHANSSTCVSGSTPAEIRNCSNWRNRLGNICSRTCLNQEYFRAAFKSAYANSPTSLGNMPTTAVLSDPAELGAGIERSAPSSDAAPSEAIAIKRQTEPRIGCLTFCTLSFYLSIGLG